VNSLVPQENVQNALLAEGVQLEVFSGDIPCVPVSGLTGKGLDDLVETISLIAETQELRAERDSDIQGYVLESKIRKGLGWVLPAFTTKTPCLNRAPQTRRNRPPASRVPQTRRSCHLWDTPRQGPLHA